MKRSGRYRTRGDWLRLVIRWRAGKSKRVTQGAPAFADRKVCVRKPVDLQVGTLGRGRHGGGNGRLHLAKARGRGRNEIAEWTKGGVLRHAEFVTVRDDKSFAEVTREL